MAISFVSRGQYVAASSGNIVLAAPTGTQEGDLLVAMIGHRDTAAFTQPSGWTLVAQESSGNTDPTAATAIASGHMSYIIQGASAPSFTFTRTGGSVAIGVVCAFRGVDPDDPFQAYVSATSPAATTTTTTSSGFTTTVPNTFLVMGLGGAADLAFNNERATQDPLGVGWTEHADNYYYGTAPTCAVAMASGTKVAVGTTGQLRATSSASSMNSIIVAAFNPIPVQSGFFVINRRRRRHGL